MEFVAPEGAQVVRILGAGSVFHVALIEYGDVTCVCKRLTPRMRDEEKAQAALRREAQFLSMALHHAVPTVIAQDRDDAGLFLLETLAEGTPLATLAERGPVPAPMLTAIATAAFDALTEIHARPQRLTLGDLAPEDLFIGKRRGDICFVDFGQSSWDGHPPREEERGTLPFTPPEVARGDAPWSQASDTYALAAMILCAAIARDPCHTEGPARLAEIAERGLDLTTLETTDLPTDRKATLRSMLALDPADRSKSW